MDFEKIKAFYPKEEMEGLDRTGLEQEIVLLKKDLDDRKVQLEKARNDLNVAKDEKLTEDIVKFGHLRVVMLEEAIESLVNKVLMYEERLMHIKGEIAG